jgi:uncharacterized protein
MRSSPVWIPWAIPSQKPATTLSFFPAFEIGMALGYRLIRRLIGMRKLNIAIAVLLFSAMPTTAVGEEPGMRLVNAARNQIGKTTLYDVRYQVLDYPNGDLPIERGVCTDVVIRAFRSALGMDLQKLVHEDMVRNFTSYPKLWRLRRPDKNIDHRRVPNLQTYLERRGYRLHASGETKDYRPGDLVTCIVPPNLPHIMIVSDKRNAKGIPLVIHNIGSGAREEDRLFEFKLTGQYRIKEVESQVRRDARDRVR